MRSMKRIHFDEIWQELTRILLALGFENSRAKRCAYIFTENTCDGVTSHGLNRFPSFVTAIKSGLVKTKVEPELVRSLGAIEQWDGMRGVGPLNAEKAMKRAIELSRGHGLGCVGLCNTNHWMRGVPTGCWLLRRDASEFAGLTRLRSCRHGGRPRGRSGIIRWLSASPVVRTPSSWIWP